MRLAVAGALASLAIVGPSEYATASFAAGTVSLRLHYEMVCGQPGRGPVVVRLPAAFRLGKLAVRVRGEPRPATVAGRTVTISLWKPPQVTCMSITEGILGVTIATVHTTAGTYVVRARIDTHSFTSLLHVH
jgi:hypothetical protein